MERHIVCPKDDPILQLLSKNADMRYNSAMGLKADLLECQKRLNQSVATSDFSLEVLQFRITIMLSTTLMSLVDTTIRHCEAGQILGLCNSDSFGASFSSHHERKVTGRSLGAKKRSPLFLQSFDKRQRAIRVTLQHRAHQAFLGKERAAVNRTQRRTARIFLCTRLSVIVMAHHPGFPPLRNLPGQ